MRAAHTHTHQHRDLPSTDSFPKWPQLPGLGQSQETATPSWPLTWVAGTGPSSDASQVHWQEAGWEEDQLAQTSPATRDAGVDSSSLTHCAVLLVPRTIIVRPKFSSHKDQLLLIKGYFSGYKVSSWEAACTMGTTRDDFTWIYMSRRLYLHCPL